jgi:hypothetical protein
MMSKEVARGKSELGAIISEIATKNRKLIDISSGEVTAGCNTHVDVRFAVESGFPDGAGLGRGSTKVIGSIRKVPIAILRIITFL